MLVAEEGEKKKEFKARFSNCSAVMERLQGPINPCFLGEHLDVECLEQGFVNTESLRFDEEEPHFLTSSLEDKMPFLQMLQSVESLPFLPFKEPNFQTLLKLQHMKKPWEEISSCMPEVETQIRALELESCVTHDIVDLHSPVKSETKDPQNPHSTSCLEGVSSELSNQEQHNSAEHCSSPPWTQPPTRPQQAHISKSPPVSRERRKRKRTRPTKNKEEVESQRMTHIAVERNRRRQMNDHLNSLRSLMPPSYIQRGDQASIIGGAIDFVKELEQLLQSLEAQKRMRKTETGGDNSASNSVMGISSNGLFTSPPPQPQLEEVTEKENCAERKGDETRLEKKYEAAGINVTVIQNHVNLKIQCPRTPGQLLKAIVALEDLRLSVLHLNITSSQTTIIYSFNLKIEDGCKLGSADEIAGAVREIFSFINGS